MSLQLVPIFFGMLACAISGPVIPDVIPRLSLFDNLVINISNETTLSQILKDVRQNWEMALHPDVNNVQLHPLLDLPFFSALPNVEGAPVLTWDGVPKSLSLVALMTNSAPVSFTDSVVLVANSRAKRDLIMSEIKSLWHNLTVGNLTDVQVEVTADRPIQDSDAYNPDSPPLRSVTYRVSGIADIGLDEYLLKQRLRETINATKNPDIFVVPALPELPAPRALLISPKVQALPFGSNLRSVFVHVTGDGASTLDATELRRRMRGIIKAFPTDGLWFVPAGDAETALLDASINDTEIGSQRRSLPMNSSVNSDDSVVMIVNYRNTTVANTSHDVTDSTILTFDAVEKSSDADNAISRISKSTLSSDAAFSWPLLDHLITSFNKIVDLTGRWFQKSV